MHSPFMCSPVVRRITRHLTLPVSLFRIQPKLPVMLRDYDTQMALKRTSFDLKLHQGLYMPATGDEFIGPNGMSLRPATPKMLDVLRNFKGTPRVYAMHEGLALPEGLVILHEHSDHYSLQTTVPIALSEYHARVTAFLQTLPNVTKDEFLAQMEDENDQDN